MFTRVDRRQVEPVDDLAEALTGDVGVLVDGAVHPAVDDGGRGPGVDARELVDGLGLAEEVGEVEGGGAGQLGLGADADQEGRGDEGSHGTLRATGSINSTRPLSAGPAT